MSIDMSPLIDCVFQLLIFFMLSSSFLTPAIDLTLPQAANAEAPDPFEVVVSISTAGDIYVNRKQVAPEQLEAELRPLLSRARNKVVSFQGDKDVRYELVVQAIAAAKAAGAESFDIAHTSADE